MLLHCELGVIVIMKTRTRNTNTETSFDIDCHLRRVDPVWTHVSPVQMSNIMEF